MGQVQVDDALATILRPLKERAEVFDAKGMSLGYFIPNESPEEQLKRKAFAEYDPERARKRRESPEGGFTTEQVQAYLKTLGDS